MASLWETIGSLSLGETRRFFDGAATFEVSLDPIPSTDLIDTFTKILYVGYDYMTLTLNFSGGSRVLLAPWLLTPSMASLEALLSLFSTLSKPTWDTCISKSLPDMFFFLFEQLRIATHCLGPMGEGGNDTEFSREVMVAIPL